MSDIDIGGAHDHIPRQAGRKESNDDSASDAKAIAHD